MKICALGAAAIVAVFADHAAHGSLVQVRDAAGGTFANGIGGGPLLAGTGSHILGSTTDNSDTALYVGTFDLEANYGSGWQPLRTYCIQPNENLGFDFNPADIVGLQYQTATLTTAGFTASEANYLQILWANAFAQSQTSALKAAAFQSVVWEFVQDNTINLSTGFFRLSAADTFTGQVKTLAQTWINNITGGVWTTSVALVALTHPSSQDFITVAVPAPGAAAMLLGVISLFSPRRRRYA